MVNYFKIIENQIIANNESFDVIHFYNISELEKNIIFEKYHIDEHSINSCFDPDEVPRLETENNYFNLIWKLPTIFKLGDETSFDVISVGFFIRDNKLIIISSNYFNYLKEKIFIKINTIYDLILFLQFTTIKHFIEHLKAIKMISRELQKKINMAMENEYLLKMFDLSELLVYYLDSINGNKSTLNKLNTFLKNTNIDYNNNFFQDMLNETDQASKQAEIYSQIFAGLMDARGTIVNNNMNVLIKKLTIINIIFLPLNLIASIGGMSEFSSITKNIPWPISYGLFSVSMIVIGWLTLLLIKKSSIK